MPNVGWSDATCWTLVFIFGALVGFSEILSRYRDEPMRAAFNRFGLSYLAINGFIAVGAFAVLMHYPKSIFPAVAGDKFMTAIVAGFGAMAVMRSKLFTFRSDDGKEYAIGPSIVIDTILRVVDRKIDRLRASQRERLVFSRLKDVSNFSAAADYLTASLLSFQNLSQDEKRDIAAVIAQYRNQAAWPDALKTMALGFTFLTLAGEENFDEVVKDLTQYISNLARPAAGSAATLSGSGSASGP